MGSKQITNRLRDHLHTATRWPSDYYDRLELARVTADFCALMGVSHYDPVTAINHDLTRPELLSLYCAAKQIIIEHGSQGYPHE